MDTSILKLIQERPLVNGKNYKSKQPNVASIALRNPTFSSLTPL